MVVQTRHYNTTWNVILIHCSFHIQETNCYSYTRKLVMFIPHTGNKLLFLYKETRHVHSTYRKQIVILIQGNSSCSFHIQETNCYSYTRKLIMFIPHTGNKLPCYCILTTIILSLCLIKQMHKDFIFNRKQK